MASSRTRLSKTARKDRPMQHRSLGVDGTVVETNIRYLTDSKTPGDGVRVLSRLVHRAKTVLADGAAVAITSPAVDSRADAATR